MMLWIALCLAAAPDAGSPPSVTLAGALITAGSATTKDLSALGAKTLEWSDRSKDCLAPATRDGERCVHHGQGVRLDVLLLARGYSEGAKGPSVDPKLKHAGLRAAVVARASDGFAAVFSIGELLETLGATEAYVVWEADGKPLAADQGPFRLVVKNDRAGTRSLRQLVSLEVVDLSGSRP